jgi:hypothetical protein
MRTQSGRASPFVRQLDFRPRAVQVINRYIRGDATQPPAEIAGDGIEPRVSPVHPPKRLQGQILRRCCVTDNAHNPPKHFALVLVEERFEGVQIASRESHQQFHARPLFTFTVREAIRLHGCLRRPAFD